MAEWLVEEGIGETRALLVESGEVLAAHLHWPGESLAGAVVEARLTRRQSGTNRGTATLADGIEALVDHLPPEVNEGAYGSVRIVRAPIAERGRLKRAQARWAGAQQATRTTNTAFPDARRIRQFEPGQWEEVWHAASSGSVEFRGGSLLCSVTPAMTLIDIDGDTEPRELALAAVPGVAKALRVFDIGGSIGIDYPSLPSKADRRTIDAALEEALADWPHERTAMNGFGFVQLVARLEGPSLLNRFQISRTSMCARYALRLAEQVEGAGTTLLTAHPALEAKLKPEWLAELQRRTGRAVKVKTDPALALEAPSAQVIAV